MLSIIGAGHMGKAMLRGLTISGRTDLVVVDYKPERHGALKEQFPFVEVVTDPVACEGAIIAVRPEKVEAVTRAAVAAGAKRILSLATGKSVAQLNEIAGVPAARAMPNVGALVGKAATSLYAQTDEMRGWAGSIMESVGTVVQLDEKDVHTATGLAGSGPAYVFLFTSAMIDAGIKAGLSEEDARTLSIATVQSAAQVLDTDSPEHLVESVALKGGTTVEGLRVLRERDLHGIVADAVVAAANRSRAIMEENS